MTEDILSTLLPAINKITDYPPLIAIDGRTASGKTTLTAMLQKELNCNVVHMDHFFLRKEQRTEERLKEAGGNVDYERFKEEVLIPLKEGKSFSYRPYDCHTLSFAKPIYINPKNITVVEGSYSCHPELREYYDIHIFLSISPEEQLRRIEKRNGKTALNAFQTKWIPMEEKYFTTFDIQNHCEYTFETDK